MRRLFSFRSSSASSGGKENPAPPDHSNENVYWETPGENAAGSAVVADGHKKCKAFKASGSPRLRRSLSFSSSPSYCDGDNRRCGSGGNLGVCQDAGDELPYEAAQNLSQTPERHLRSKRCSKGMVHNSHTFEKLDSLRTSRDHHGSKGNSPCSPPVTLRCRSSRVTQSLNAGNILDLYIDGEQHGKRFLKESQPPVAANDDGILEKRPLPSFGRPPRAQYTAPSSPTRSKESLKSHSFREEKGINGNFTLDCLVDEVRFLSPKQYSKNFIQKQSVAFCGKAKMKSLDNESQTSTTVEDIYEDLPNHVHNCTLSGHIHPDVMLSEYCPEDSIGFDKQSQFLQDASLSIRRETGMSLDQQDENVNAELIRRLKEVEEQSKVQPELDIDFDKFWKSKFCSSRLIHMVREVMEERKNLASELSSQIHARISERSTMMQALKQAKVDIDTRTRRLEKEKNELQLSLEKELDRRSTDWSFKLEKFQAEEQRLRDRVRELAEQNVSLQREISLHRGKEMMTQTRIIDSETKLDEMATSLEEMRNTNATLQQSLSELHEQCEMAETNQECIKRSYKEKETEIKDLQKIVSKMQKTCSEQEKTIGGLRQAYTDGIGRPSREGDDDLVCKLQLEHIRLTGVEQTSRKEVESFRLEVESLRKENIYILGRLQCAGNSCCPSLLRIDQELCTQIECLQSQSCGLLDDSTELSGKLLRLVNSKQCNSAHSALHEPEGYAVMECTMKLESLKRAVKIFKGRLQAVSIQLDQRSEIEASGCQSQKRENEFSSPCDSISRNDELEVELKAEILLTRILREKLFHKEQEQEQLLSDLASSVRENELLKSEIQRTQDDLSYLSHKMKDMELKMTKKDENFTKLHHEHQECLKELAASRDVLPRVSKERDNLFEEMKRSKETNMHFDYEIKSLKKKIEALEDDILIKEGQITMLKDNLANRNYEILYSPTAMEHILE